MGLEDQNIQHQGSDIWHGERSASSAALSNQSSEFSIKFKSSTFINGSTDIDESQMWKVHVGCFLILKGHCTVMRAHTPVSQIKT